MTLVKGRARNTVEITAGCLAAFGAILAHQTYRTDATLLVLDRPVSLAKFGIALHVIGFATLMCFAVTRILSASSR